jgi:hypothetical protein
LTKHGMRGFAAGILLASGIVALYYYQLMPKNDDEKAEAPLTESRVDAYLASKGEIAVDKAAFEKWQASESQKASGDQGKAADKSSANDDKKNADQPKVYKAKITVKQGMTTSDVAEALEKQHVIKDRHQLTQYVIDHKLEPYLQLGTYTFTSDMSIPDIAKKLTTK